MPLFVSQRRFTLPLTIYMSHSIQILKLFHRPFEISTESQALILQLKKSSTKLSDSEKTSNNPSSLFQKTHLINKMGNPNQRLRPATQSPKVQPPQQPVVQPAVQPKPVQPNPVYCTNGDCPVWNYHIAKVYKVSDCGLPDIIKTKHAALNETLAARKFSEARFIRRFLERFYTVHGPADGSALVALPAVPEKPKQCHHSGCPVKKYHHEKNFKVDSEDLPFIVKDIKKRFEDALKESDYKRAVTTRAFLVKFFVVHGPSVLEILPPLPLCPPRCQDRLCPVPTFHADKVYGQHAHDLPRVVQKWMARTWEIDSESGYWAGSKEQKLLNEFWAVHGGSGKDTKNA